MLPAANRGAGMNMGFPDVCNTIVGPATVPIPYPNIAMNAQAAPFAMKVKIRGMNALNQASKIPMTSGDEAGTAHPTVKGQGAYTMGSPKVKIEGMPAIHLTNPTTGNNMNNGVGMVAVPSAVNVFYTDRRHDLDWEARTQSASLEVEDRGSVVVVRLPAFARDLGARFAAVQRKHPTAPMIFDLRGNPGGALRAALTFADLWLPAGTALVTLVHVDGDHDVHRARLPRHDRRPLAVVVDGATASAAEVLAGALQTHARAVIVGEPTYGKGVACVTTPGGPRTAGSCLRPDGRALQERGVLPNVLAASDGAVDVAQAVLTSC